MSSVEMRYEELATKAVDGLLSGGEEKELEEILSNNPQWREELEDFVAIKKTTDAMRNRIAADARIEPPRESDTTRRGLSMGFLLMVIGMMVLLGFGAYELMRSDEIPLWWKVGYGLLGSGILGLFLYVLRNRIRSYGEDPYREIDR